MNWNCSEKALSDIKGHAIKHSALIWSDQQKANTLLDAWQIENNTKKLARLRLYYAIRLINSFPLLVCSLRLKHVHSLMNICIHKTANFFPAVFCWEGLIAVNEKVNREGANTMGPNETGELLHSHKDFSSVTLNFGAASIHLWNLEIKRPCLYENQVFPCSVMTLPWSGWGSMFHSHLWCGHFNPLSLTV